MRLADAGEQHELQADVRRRLGVGFAAKASAEAAVLAGADLDALGVDVGRTCVARRQRKRVIAQLVRGLLEQLAGVALLERLVGILVAAHALERVAARNESAAQIAGFARGAAELVKTIEVRLELVIGDAPILD